MDDGSPALEVGFAIDTSGSYEELLRLQALMDTVEARIVADAAKIERATGDMVNLGGATAAIRSFGSAATREFQSARAEYNRVEKAGEAMVRQLERQAAAFGKTREELRQVKAETAALAAEQQGQSELAGRIRSSQSGLVGRELAAAEARQVAVQKAAQATEAEAQAVRSAARAYDAFQTAARNGMEALRDQQAAEQRLVAETNQLRAALDPMFAAQKRFDTEMERADRLLAAGSISTREYAAAQDLARDALNRHAQAVTGAGAAQQAAERERQSAIMSSDAYAAKIEAETTAIGRSAAELREMEVAQRAAAAAAAGLPDQAERIRAAGAAYAAAQAQASALTAEQHRLAAASREAAEAARLAATAQTAQDASVHSLRSAVDPLYGSQVRLRNELENAARLYRAGAIGQDEYARSSAALAAQLDNVQRAQARQRAGGGDAAGARTLGGSDIANIVAQINDIGVSLAGGQNPFLVMIQQGSQLQGIMMQTGVSIGGMARAIAGLFIVTTPTAVAATALAEAELAQAAAMTASTGASATAAITAAELAVANEIAAAATLADAAAQQALAVAQAAVTGTTVADAQALAALTAAQIAATGTAAELITAEVAVAGAELAAAGASEVAAAAARQLAIAQEGAAASAASAAATATRSLAPWLAALLPIGAALGVAAVGVGLFQRSVASGIDTKAMVAGLGLTHDEIKRLKNTSVDTGDVVKATFQVMAEHVGISLDGFGKAWSSILDWMTDMGRRAMARLYSNTVGTFQAMVAAIKALTGGKGIEGAIADATSTWKEADAYANRALTQIGKDITDRARSNKQTDLNRQRDAIVADRSPRAPKVDRHAETLGREMAATEALIAGLYDQAKAYRVSDAAAMQAEVTAKAREQGIKKEADLTAYVALQLRKAVAEHAVAGAKAAADLAYQVRAQNFVNDAVRAGTLDINNATAALTDMAEQRSLVAAISVAAANNDVRGAEAAKKALQDLTDAQIDSHRVARETESLRNFETGMTAGDTRLAELREELRLIGATDEARARSMAEFKAGQETSLWKGISPEKIEAYIKLQGDIAAQGVTNTQAQDAYNDALTLTAEKWDIIAGKVQSAGQGMADAFGSAGRAISDLASVYSDYQASREHAEAEHVAAITKAGNSEKLIAQENARFALRSSGAQIEAYGDMVSSAKGFFKEGSSGYKALAAAEKVYRIAQFAMSLQAMVQHALETTTHVAGAAAQATADGTAGIAAQAKLPFPANIAAMAATGAALVAAGIAVFGGFGGGKNTLPQSNTGTGTVLGDSAAKSESISRSIDALKEVDTVMLTYSRQMAASLRSIEDQIGGFASLVLRTGNVNASGDVTEGFKANGIGSALGAIPLVGGILKGLFGTKTKVVGSGLFGGSQSLDDILSGGFDASYYSDIQKKKKFFGLTTSTKYKTSYSEADGGLENQFTLILRQFNAAILAAAGPLGESTAAIQQKLSGFVVDIGKIDLQGLTGAEIEEKLSAVFGAAADKMATTAFPGIERFQKVGEGLFETLVRVSSTVESVTASLGLLGSSAGAMSTDIKLALADQFDSVSDFTGAIDTYFEAYFTKEEQAAARTAQFAQVFDSLSLSMPASLAGFRSLVEAQDLTTAAGQATYATLLQLAPAFADLNASLDGAKSVADILSERQDLQRQLLELDGDTATIRALDLAKLDGSNRALQEQVWAVRDAQDAAAAAKQLRDAWTSVGDSIMTEVKRIRGLTDVGGDGSFAGLMGQFNAATSAARGGDQDAAKLLPGLSQSLLKAAADTATSRQELARVQAQTAASLEATYGAISQLGLMVTPSSTSTLAAAATAAQATGATTTAANDDLVLEVRALRDELAQLRTDNNAGHAATSGNTGQIARKLDDVTAASGGDAISVASAA